MMSADIFTVIYNFNEAAGLLDSGYDDFRESSFQIEEALEGFDCSVLADSLSAESAKPRDIARAILTIAENSQSGIYPLQITDVDRLDKACDAIVFAVGSMAKLGLTPADMQTALNIVMTANMAKLGCPRDSFGKLCKPVDFPHPEPALQQLLDNVSLRS